MFYFFCFFFRLILTLVRADDYKVINFGNSPGIYYDNLGTITFFDTNWKLVTYLDLTVINEKLNLIHNSFSKTKQLCIENKSFLKTRYCNTSLPILSTTISSLETRENELKNLLGHKRVKRGWFNAIGTVFKTITGVLDNDDAEYYNDSIDKLNSNELDLTHLLKSQIQIVQTTIQNFNDSITNLHKNEKIFNENIETLQKYAETLNRDSIYLHVAIHLDQHIQLQQLMTNELNRELSALINAVLFAKQNIIHPIIITPSQLVKELSKTNQHLPFGTNYPCILDDLHIHQILDILTLQAYFMDNKLIYIISIPLVNSAKFELYHLIPLPVLHNENLYVFVQPSLRYLAMSVTKLQYTLLENLNDCKFSTELSYICKSAKPIFSTRIKPVCETEFLFSNTFVPKSCDKRIIPLSSEIWHKLEKKNQWIFVLPHVSDITISCGSNAKLYDVRISGSGIFDLTSNCKAFTASTILTAESSVMSNYFSILPSFNITDDCCEKDKLNISLLHLHSIPTARFNLESLDVASHKLESLTKLADQIANNHSLKRHVSFFTYVLYILLFLTLLIISYWIIKRCLRRFKLSNFKEHDHETNSCSKIINCLTFNVGNRNTRRSSTSSRTKIELHKIPASNSLISKNKTCTNDDLISEDSEDEIYPDNTRESPMRRTVIKDKL